MPTYEEEVRERVYKFLNETRSEKSRQDVREIIEYLIAQKKESYPGWTRSGQVYSALHDKINNVNTITRLLKNLHKAHLIERKECPRKKGYLGKPPVFYRVPVYYQPILFQTREELIQEHERVSKWLVDSVTREMACELLLAKEKGKGIPEITKLVKKQAKKMQAEQEKYMEQIKKHAIPDVDPCESL